MVKIITANTVIKPYTPGVPLDLTVAPGDRLAYAIEQMLLHNRTKLAVIEAGAPVGIILLDDALFKLGIRVPCTK